MSIQKVIDRLEAMPKRGESYDHKGRHGWANPIRQDTGPLLEALVLARQPGRILEIGTAHGLSACYMAKRLPGYGKIVTIEWDENRAKEARANFAEADLPVTVLNGDAMQIIPNLVGDGEFDFIFMDANKDGYAEQLRLLVYLGLISPGNCTIVADNVIDRKVECAEFLEMMTAYPHIVLPTECGLLVGTI